MSDRDDRRKPDYDLTTPNVYPPEQQPPRYNSGDEFDRTTINQPPQGGAAGRRPPPASGAGNKYDLTSVNIYGPLGADEDDEYSYGAGAAAQAAGQQHAPTYPAQYPPGAYPPPQQHVQTQPAAAQQRPRAPAWARVAGWGLLAFSLLLAGGFAVYLLWPSSGFTLRVLNAPHGSKVFVDDVRVGVSNTEGAIVVGALRPDEMREVRVAHEGYVDWRTTVEGRRGETKILRVRMTPLPKTESALPEALDQIEQDLDSLGRARVFGINFDPGSDRIRDESKPPLDTVVGILKKRPEWAITIEGHTDSTAAPQYNQELSQRRAAAVRSYLQSGGIDASRLATAGYGASRPVADNDTPVGRALNRRVEFIRR
jgi:outer membrane protein OmpA-like peptidoglycan-associated protein